MQVYKPGTQIPEVLEKERMKIRSDHFRKLNIAGSEGSKLKIKNKSREKIGMISDSPISWSEIFPVLKKLRKRKASGPDMKAGQVYKLVENEYESKSNRAKIILKMFNGIYFSNSFPIEWKD